MQEKKGKKKKKIPVSYNTFQDEFHVDRFVVECRRRGALETLQEDLNVYLKTLQSAMIELINKDYADFVNLSTNLVSYMYFSGFGIVLHINVQTGVS